MRATSSSLQLFAASGPNMTGASSQAASSAARSSGSTSGSARSASAAALAGSAAATSVNAAKIAAYVNYVSPVKGAKEELLKIDPEIANNTLIIPDDALLEQMHQYDSSALSNDEHISKWQSVLGQ